MATISEIARHAGVGVSTVSRYLNDHPYISEDKRERIQAAIEELDYTPSAIASQLRTRTTPNIGVLVSRITNPFFTQFFDAVERELHQHGYQVMVSQTYNDAASERAFLDKLKSREIEAVILASVESAATVGEIADAVPNRIVVLNQTFPTPNLQSVTVDHYTATTEALEHLSDNGARRIAYATGGQFGDTRHGRDRNEAYRDFLTRHDQPLDEDIIFTDRHTVGDGADLARTVAGLAPAQRPDAFFANSDEVATGLIGGLADQGVRVPGEIAVIGYDDQPMAPYLSVPLTTIRQPVAEMARAAVLRLLRDFDVPTTADDSPDPGNLDLTPRLVIRASA